MNSLPTIFAGSFVIGSSGTMMPGPLLTVPIHEPSQAVFWSDLLQGHFGGTFPLSGGAQLLGVP